MAPKTPKAEPHKTTKIARAPKAAKEVEPEEQIQAAVRMLSSSLLTIRNKPPTRTPDDVREVLEEAKAVFEALRLATASYLVTVEDAHHQLCELRCQAKC